MPYKYIKLYMGNLAATFCITPTPCKSQRIVDYNGYKRLLGNRSRGKILQRYATLVSVASVSEKYYLFAKK
ncbi:hypothetical protein NUACC21_72960 [Scytonema sp. NUACC21]